jgi:FAD:protein FMN transferase
MEATVPGSCRVEQVMGMPIIVDVRDEGDADVVLDELFAWLEFVDTTFSTYKEDSEISRLNRGALDLAEAHRDVREVLARCECISAETNGYFDIRAAASPGTIDPSGLVKGWSIDRAAAILDAAGFDNYAINAGGDMILQGGALPDSVWRVGIQHPRVLDKIAAVVTASNLAVATSGAYARGDHVLDPHTGRAPSTVLSVTITGPSLTTADAYATAAFAMDADGPEWTRGLQGYEAMTILGDGQMLFTPGFPLVS